MAMVVEKNGFKWVVDDGYIASMESIREHEFSVIELCKVLGGQTKSFVDVGACVGKYTVPMSKVYGLVVAIEPNERNLEFLKQNLELNGCDNVIVVGKAVSDVAGKTKLKLDGAQSHIDADGEENTVDVVVDRLDNLIDGADVIKIDVEGAEHKVVFGSEKIIDSHNPVFVVEHNEYWFSDEPEQHRKILEFLSQKGYEAYNYNSSHWVYIHKSQLDKIDDDIISKLIANHIFFDVILRNLKNGHNWYHGLPDKWWWGMSVLEFYIKLQHHALDDEVWDEVRRKTLKIYE